MFASPVQADERALESGFFKSVGSTRAIKRLRDSGIGISLQDLGRVKRVGTLRNQLQHFDLSATTEAVRAVTIHALDFLIRFVDQELRDIAPEDVEVALDDIRMDSLRLRSWQRFG